MAVLSGKNGTLYVGSKQITPVLHWKLEITGNHRDYVANDTGGWRKRAAGAKDCRGSFQVSVTENGNCPVEEAQPATLKLHVDDTGNNYYDVEVIIGRIGVETSISDGKAVVLGIEFSGHGSVTPHGVLATSESP